MESVQRMQEVAGLLRYAEVQVLVFVIAVAVAVLVWWLVRRGHGKVSAGADPLMAELVGRMAQMAESHAAQQSRLAERMQAQERVLAQVLDQGLTEVSRRVGEGLQQGTDRTTETLHDLRERLALIDAAQNNLRTLSEQVVGLQDILSNKQARGAFGEVQLHDIVTAALPQDAYRFQVTLSNARRADCMILLPDPPGPIAVDAKFPLDGYQAYRNAETEAERKAGAKQFRDDVVKHVKDIAARYILPGETAESALMFLPSEAVYAELHATFREVIELSYQHRVWIVSPTTLMATLNTVRAVLKDVHMRKHAGTIQREVGILIQDVQRLDGRLQGVFGRVDQMQREIPQVQASMNKIIGRAQKIEAVQLGDDTQVELFETQASRGHQDGVE